MNAIEIKNLCFKYNVNEQQDILDDVSLIVKKGEYVSAGTMGTISVLYGPEDLREVKSAYKQIRALFENKEYKNCYC